MVLIQENQDQIYKLRKIALLGIKIRRIEDVTDSTRKA